MKWINEKSPKNLIENLSLSKEEVLFLTQLGSDIRAYAESVGPNRDIWFSHDPSLSAKNLVEKIAPTIELLRSIKTAKYSSLHSPKPGNIKIMKTTIDFFAKLVGPALFVHTLDVIAPYGSVRHYNGSIKHYIYLNTTQRDTVENRWCQKNILFMPLENPHEFTDFYIGVAFWVATKGPKTINKALK